MYYLHYLSQVASLNIKEILLYSGHKRIKYKINQCDSDSDVTLNAKINTKICSHTTTLKFSFHIFYLETTGFRQIRSWLNCLNSSNLSLIILVHPLHHIILTT